MKVSWTHLCGDEYETDRQAGHCRLTADWWRASPFSFQFPWTSSSEISVSNLAVSVSVTSTLYSGRTTLISRSAKIKGQKSLEKPATSSPVERLFVKAVNFNFANDEALIYKAEDPPRNPTGASLQHFYREGMRNADKPLTAWWTLCLTEQNIKGLQTAEL